MPKLHENAAKLFRDRNWAVVVTRRKDGSPHSTPVWIDTDGEHVLVNTTRSRAKFRHLQRDPAVVVTVLPSENLQSGYVTVYGRAVEFVDEGAAAHIDKLAKKYIGADVYPNHNPDDPRVIVKILPERVEAQGVAAG